MQIKLHTCIVTSGCVQFFFSVHVTLKLQIRAAIRKIFFLFYTKRYAVSSLRKLLTEVFSNDTTYFVEK